MGMEGGEWSVGGATYATFQGREYWSLETSLRTFWTKITRTWMRFATSGRNSVIRLSTGSVA
jgi:hypothetical protein